MSIAFWNDKLVFLTGHTGFKGGWMALMLRRLGARVVGFSDAVPTSPSLFDVAGVAADLVEDLRADVSNFVAVRDALAASRPDIVVHMAAQPIVKAGYSDPVTTYATNVMGTAHVLKAASDCHSVRVVLVVTSDKCYENRDWPWGYRETDELGGHDPYSSSKACAELVTSSFRRSFFSSPDSTAAVATGRAGNVVGGGDFAADRIVPDAWRAFDGGSVLQVRNPQAIRPWQHVLDPIQGYLLLIEHAWASPANFAEAWNFGPSATSEQSVETLVGGIVARWGEGASWQQDFCQHPKETHFLRIDASKARQRLGWEPLLSFAETLDWTTRWYFDFSRGWNARALTLGQVDDYLDRISEGPGSGTRRPLERLEVRT